MTSSPQSEKRDAAGSPERFGYSWGVFDEILPEHEEQFRRWVASMPDRCWKAARVLDVGCGMGRNSYWARKAGAGEILAIDLDDRSLAAARRNLRELDGVVVEKRSVYDLDRQGQFDIAFSIGVIHHLADPGTALRKMTDAVRPGGRVLVWVYGYENNEWVVRWFNPLRRALFSRMPLRIAFMLSLPPTLGLWVLLKLGWGRLPYHQLLRGIRFSHLRAIVFDQMIPKIAHYWRKHEVLKLMADAGLQDVAIEWVNGMSWSACGTRPTEAAKPDQTQYQA